MRIGSNPNRSLSVTGYAPVIAAMITHLPNVDGYHAQRFDVIKLALGSMRENALEDCEIFVWDNGSCPDFLHWLQDDFRPDYLVLSKNIGKASARAGIVRSLPPKTIIGVADDDMYFYRGWLAESIKILKHFPNVGQVSGYPVRTQARWGNKNTLTWAEKYAKLERGKFIPEQYDRDFCSSIGRDYAYQIGYTAGDLDPRITYKDVQVYGTAHHCQFIGYAGVLAPFAIWDTSAMGDEKPFDNAVDAAGLLRLTTTQRYTRHMGNTIDKDIMQEVWNLCMMYQ